MFVGILKATEKKSRIRIRNPKVIRGSGSISKRYGSGTLKKWSLQFNKKGTERYLAEAPVGFGQVTSSQAQITPLGTQ
jgi:hypothetical protein